MFINFDVCSFYFKWQAIVYHWMNYNIFAYQIQFYVYFSL